MRLRNAALCLLALLAFVSLAGTSQNLRLELACHRMRSHAPILARAKFTVAGARLFEGRLELVFRGGGLTLSSWRSHELSLAAGEQTYDFLLPAVEPGPYGGPVDIQAALLTRDGPIPLETGHWNVASSLDRSCIVAVSSVREDWTSGFDRTLRHLGLDALHPKLPEGTRRALYSQPVKLAPDELPSHPLSYCAFDVLFLAGKGLAFLRGPQLDAIVRWVRAGGSVCVAPSGTLGERHVKFLNDLADGTTALFSQDGQGRLIARDVPAGVADKVRALELHSGLGRSVVLLTPPTTDEIVGSAYWRDVVAFLWKIRADQLPFVLGDGHFRLDRARWSPHDYSYSEQMRLEGTDELQGRMDVIPLCRLHELIGGLMPQNVRVVPFAAIVIILVLFVAAVGPLDYFVLGRLRQRRLTWLVFPLVAVGFTWATMRLAEHYMGRKDIRRSLTFVDLDSRGRAVRQSRYEMIFSASSRIVRHELRDALFGVLGRRGDEYGLYAPVRRRRPYMAGEGMGEAEHVAVEGRMPSQFVAAQDIGQWEAVVNRTFTLEPPEHPPALDWDRLAKGRHLGASTLVTVPDAFFGPGKRKAAAYVLHQQELRRAGSAGTWGMPSFGHLSLEDLCLRASVHPQLGFFSIVSQLSPTGAASFEDLAMLDPTDKEQWLLVVIEQVGDDYFIYRRLYRGAG